MFSAPAASVARCFIFECFYIMATNLKCYKIVHWPMTLGQKWPTRPIGDFCSPLAQGRDRLDAELGTWWGKVWMQSPPCRGHSCPGQGWVGRFTALWPLPSLFRSAPEMVYVSLALLSSIHCLAFQSSVEKGVCNGQQPNSQGAHPSAVGSWASGCSYTQVATGRT